MVVPTSGSDAAANLVRNSPCVLFAYHEIGHACTEALLSMGAPIVGMFTHRDNPHEEIWWRSCAQLAQSNSIPVYTPEKLDQRWVDVVAAMRPAVIYSFYYRNLLDDALLRLALLGAYNMHGSLLPKYRGRSPVNWMLVNGEHEAGVTLHHMVRRADAGDIVAQRAIQITDDDTALTLYRKIVPIGASLIREYHPLIVSGFAPRHPQDLSAGSYFGRRRPDDGRIDWRWPARRVFNLIRAVTHPYPGAFCFDGSRRLYIWRARIGAESGYRGEPGTIVAAASAGGVEIAAGEGSVVILTAQFESEFETSAAQALCGAVGARLRLE